MPLDTVPQPQLDTDLSSIPILVAAHANRDLQDHQVLRVITALQAKMDKTDKREPLEKTAKFCCLLCHQRNRALFARQEFKETLDNPDLKDPLDLKENPLKRPTMERRASQAFRDRKEFQDLPDHQVQPDQRDNPAWLIK